MPDSAPAAVDQPTINQALPTILAVDDETSILESYKANLEEQYNVICASSGEEAVGLLQRYKNQVDLCIVDVNLPDSNMINCPEELLKIKSTVPFIVATGQANNGSLDHFLSQSRTFWLHKPFPPSHLKKAVERLLEVY